MRRVAWAMLGVWLACGSGGGGSDPGGDPGTDLADGGRDVVADVLDVADVPGDPGMEGPDTVAPPDPGTTDESSDPAVGDAPDGGQDGATDVNFEWDPSPTPGCVDGFCAAGPDHAPDPRVPGPFPVGVRRVVFTDPGQVNYDGTPRTLVTEIWYPTTREYYDPHPKFAYDIREDIRKLPQFAHLLDEIEVDIGTFPVDAVLDAPVRHGDGRFPLVLFSHGAFGIRYQSIFYTVPLASHGYIVVAPDHEKNTLYDLLAEGYSGTHLADSAVARPLDIRFLMDQMARWDADPTSDFYKTIQTDNVGITGHSFGGYTCFAAAYPSDENGWAELDPRVKVIVPQAPAGYLLGALGIYGPDWHLPTLIEGGELDRTLEFQQAFKDPWDTLGAPKWFLDLKRGGHFTFSDLCRLNLLQVAEELGYEDAKNALTDGCGEMNWDWREAHVAIRQYSIGLFNRILRHSPGSDVWLTAEAGSEYGDEIEFLSVTE